MIIVDADTILYRVGFTHPPSSDAALRQLNVYIDVILNRVVCKFPKLETSNHLLCLTENKETRYRDVFSKTVKYKEHRSKAAPPSWMEEMKEFCIDAYITHYIPSNLAEADDAVAWEAYNKHRKGEDYVIVGVDKDLKQIPGLHFNYVKDLFTYISPEEANRFFFHQLLTGDVADNIPGIKGIGDARAKALLNKGKTPQQWWDIVLETYNKYHTGMDEDTLCDLLYERGNLLWIQRHEGQTWYPPIPEDY